MFRGAQKLFPSFPASELCAHLFPPQHVSVKEIRYLQSLVQENANLSFSNYKSLFSTHLERIAGGIVGIFALGQKANGHWSAVKKTGGEFGGVEFGGTDPRNITCGISPLDTVQEVKDKEVSPQDLNSYWQLSRTSK